MIPKIQQNLNHQINSVSPIIFPIPLPPPTPRQKNVTQKLSSDESRFWGGEASALIQIQKEKGHKH